LYDREGEVPAGAYKVTIGEANVISPGKHVTCVATSYQVLEALQAKEQLLSRGIDMEVIDLRSIRPLDKNTILRSVAKTGRLIVTDTGFKTLGVSAEIAACVVEEGFSFLREPIVRIALPDAPTPCASNLEEAYYPKVSDIIEAAEKLVAGKTSQLPSSLPNRPGKINHTIVILSNDQTLIRARQQRVCPRF
jgi:pyruvate dehydrogenase E1 component beta subunit